MFKIIPVSTNTAFAQSVPNWPDVGGSPDLSSNVKITIWGILLGILVLLVVFFLFKKGKK